MEVALFSRDTVSKIFCLSFNSIAKWPTRVSVNLDIESMAFKVLNTAGVAFFVNFTYS